MHNDCGNHTFRERMDSTDSTERVRMITALSSQSCCGFIGCNGRSMPGNKETSVQVMKSLNYLVENDPNCQMNLGKLYDSGAPNIRRSNARALRHYFAAAQQGNTDAQIELGKKYEEGKGVAMGHTEAIIWYTKAASLGSAKAKLRLADIHLEGKIVPANDFEAVRLFVDAADAGLSSAMIKLGDLTLAGRGGLEKNKHEAFRWFEKAAYEQLDPIAQHKTADMLLDGIGTKQNLAEAARLYHRAASAGLAASICALGNLYAAGKGVSHSYLEASKLYKKAALMNDPQAAYYLGVLIISGHAGELNFGQAIHWFELAAKQGIKLAKFELDALHESLQSEEDKCENEMAMITVRLDLREPVGLKRSGLRVTHVLSGSQAEAGGIEPGFFVANVWGRSVKNAEDLKRMVEFSKQKKGGLLLLKFRTTTPYGLSSSGAKPILSGSSCLKQQSSMLQSRINMYNDAKRKRFEAKIRAVQAKMSARSTAASVIISARAAAFNARMGVLCETPRTSAKARARKKQAAEAAKAASKAVKAAAQRIIIEKRKAAEEAIKAEAQTKQAEEDAKQARAIAIARQRDNIKANREAEKKKILQQKDAREKREESHQIFMSRIKASWPQKRTPVNIDCGKTSQDRAERASKAVDELKTFREENESPDDQESSKSQNWTAKIICTKVSTATKLASLGSKREAHRQEFQKRRPNMWTIGQDRADHASGAADKLKAARSTVALESQGNSKGRKSISSVMRICARASTTAAKWTSLLSKREAHRRAFLLEAK